MTAKTLSTDATRKDGQMISCPMLAAEIIYKGTPTFAKASGGLAFSNDGSTNTLANGDVFLGISVEGVDNSAGAASAESVRTYVEGAFLLTFSDTLTQDNIGDKVFVNNVSDDSVVTTTSDTGNPEVCIGVISEFVSASSAYVKITGYALKKADSTVGDVEIADASIVKAKVSYEIKTVTVSALATSGTATVVAGGEIVGIIPAGNQDQLVDNVAISGTTLTVTLAAAATADNTFKVFVLKA